MDCSDEYVDDRSSPVTKEEDSYGVQRKEKHKKEQNVHSTPASQHKPNNNQSPETQTDVQTGNQTERKGSEITDLPDVASNNRLEGDNHNTPDSKQKDLVSQKSKADKELEDEVASFHGNTGEAHPQMDTDASLDGWVNISSTNVSLGNMSGDGFQDVDMDIRSEVTSADNRSSRISPGRSGSISPERRGSKSLGRSGSTSPGRRGSKSPGRSGSKSPGRSGSKSPGRSGSTSPERSGSKSPGRSGSTSPGRSGSKSPGRSGSKSPGRSGSTSPGRSGSKSPGRSGSKSPGRSGSTSPERSGSKSPERSGSKSPGRSGSKSPERNVNETSTSHQRSTDTDSDTEQDSSHNHEDNDAGLTAPPRETFTDDGQTEIEKNLKNDDNDADLYGPPNPVANPQRETYTADAQNEVERPFKDDDNDADLYGPANPLSKPQREMYIDNGTKELERPCKNDDSDDDLYGPCNPLTGSESQSDADGHPIEPDCSQSDVDNANDVNRPEGQHHSPQREAGFDAFGNNQDRSPKYDNKDYNPHGPSNQDTGEKCNKSDVECDDNSLTDPTGHLRQTDAESYLLVGTQGRFESPQQNVHESQEDENEEWHMAEEELPEQTPQTNFQHTPTEFSDAVQHDDGQYEERKGNYEVPSNAPPGFSQQPECISQERRYEFQNDSVTTPYQRTNIGAVPDLQSHIPPQYYQAEVQSGFPPAGSRYVYPDVHSNVQGPENIAHVGYGPERFSGPHGAHHVGYQIPRLPQMQNSSYGYNSQTRHQGLIIDPNTGYPAQPLPPYGAAYEADWDQFYSQPSSMPSPPQQTYDQQQRQEHYRNQQFLQQQQHHHQEFTGQHHMQPAPAAQQEDYRNEHPNYKTQKEPLQTILVEGIGPNDTEDVLEMYFENTKRSGGGEIQGQIKMDKRKKTAYITYENEEVARRVAEKKDHVCNRHVLKVSLYDPDERPPELDANTIAVTGFPPTMTKDTLEMYFENKRSRGGSILEACFSPKKDVLYIKFQKEGVAQDVTAKTNHKLEGSPLIVTLDRPKAIPNWSPKAVAITGFDANSDDDTIEMYFESKKKSHGGEIEKYDRGKGVIYITFQEQAVADRVLKKTDHHVGGMTLTVVKAGMEEPEGQPDADEEEEEEEEEEPATTIEIRGYDKKASDDSVALYFENKRKSGGGPTTDLKRNDKTGVIYITFETDEIAERVVKREHKLSGRSLQVKLVSPQVMYKDKVLLRGVPVMENENYEALRHYMEGKTQLDVHQLLFGEEDGDVLVVFSEDIKDLESLKNTMKARPFKQGGENFAFNVETVPKTTSITVWDISEQITEEQLKLYFDNTKRSGGTDVEDVTKNNQDRYAVIKFQNAKVAENVYKRKHKLRGLPVEVSLYFECLGESGGFLEPPCSKLPDTFKVSDLDEWKLRHLAENNIAKVCLKKKMASANTGIDLNLMNRLATLTPNFSLNTPDARSICRNWRETAEAVFTNELGLVKVERISVSTDIWTEVKSKVAEMQFPQEIQVFVDKERAIVTTGPEETLSKTASGIQEAVDGIQIQYDRKKNEVVDKVGAHPAKLRLLQMQGMLAAIQAEGLLVEVDEAKWEIRFTGQKEDVQSGMMKAYEELNKIKQQTNVSRFTPNQVKLLHHTTVSEVLVKNLQDQPSPLHGTWEPGKEGVMIYYTTEDNIEDVLRYIGASLKEIKLPLDREGSLLLSSSGFKECVAGLTQAHEDRVIITPEPEKHQIIITAVSSDCESVESVLKRYFQGNSIYTVPYKCDAIQLKFVMVHCGDELDAIERELEVFCVRFVRQNKDPNFALTLKSTKAGQAHAIKLIDCITRRITKHVQYISRPGMKGYLEGESSVLQRIERDSRCVISLREANSDNAGDLSVDETSMVHDIAFVCSHRNEAQLHIAVGDLISLVPDVDAVVVEVTPGLSCDSEQGWEVISRAGEKAVSELRRLSGQKTEGDVVSTSAGALSCKMIIYAVGPTGENDPEYVIKTVVSESLETAANKRMKSLAFPAFNTRTVSVNLSSDDALKAVVEAVHEFFSTNQHSSVKEIFLCTEDWQQCTPLWDIAMDVFGKDNVKGNDGGLNATGSLHGGQRRGMGHRKPSARNRYESDEVQEEDYGEASGGLEEDLPSFSNRLKPRILLVKADMGVEEADVIVNSSNTHLNLNQGQVSKSLLKHAGQAIQIECKEKYPKGVTMGGIAVTKGGDMQCVEQIYHCVLPSWNATTGKKTFTDTLKALLTKTHQSKWKTMAIPALGTGNLGYSRDLVAKLMYDTVIQFGKDNPETTINDVLFIVYPGDEKTIQAFEAEHKKYIELTGGTQASSQKEIDAERDEELEAYRNKLKSDKAKRDESAGMSIARAVKAVGNYFSSKERKRDAPVEAPRPPPRIPKKPPATRTVPKPSDVKIWIYTDDDANVTKAVDMIYKDWDRKADTVCMKEHSIRLWSPDEINDLKIIEQACDVSITVNKAKPWSITLHGLKNKLPDANQKVHEMIHALEKKRKEEEYADGLQKVVEWSYVEVTEDGEDRVVAYDKKVNVMLERAYTKEEKKMEYQDYTFDFIRWEEYPREDPTDTVTMIRRDKVSGASGNLPNTWDVMTPTEDVKIPQVPNGKPEFTRVQKIFTAALGNTPAQIRRIDRVQSKTLYQQYQAKKQQMEKQNPGSQVERTLWHGTPKDATMSIVSYGFNRSYCDKENNALGEGAYFTSDAAYAARDRYAPTDGQGNRYMFLCKVLTGSYTQGKSQIRTPPPKTPGQPEMYDSVVDDPADPKIFVIFRDTQAYPEYLISFQ